MNPLISKVFIKKIQRFNGLADVLIYIISIFLYKPDSLFYISCWLPASLLVLFVILIISFFLYVVCTS